MGSLPTGFQVDIEFTAGVWTNVTQYAANGTDVQIQYGRTSPTGSPQVATCALRLDNFDGRFTPYNFASPFYPNVLTRKRLRVSYGSGASVRFTGFIKQWLPQLVGGLSYMTVSAVDLFERLAPLALNGINADTALALAPAAYFPLTDGAGTATTDSVVTSPVVLSELTGAARGTTWSAFSLAQTAAAYGAIVFGGSPITPYDGDGGGSLEFDPLSPPSGPTWGLRNAVVAGSTSALTIAGWMGLDGTTANTQSVAITLGDASVVSGAWTNAVGVVLYTNGLTQAVAKMLFIQSGAVGTNDVTGIVGAGGYHYALTITANGSTGTVQLYINGVLRSTIGPLASLGAILTMTGLNITATGAVANNQPARVSQVGVWNRVLSGSEVASLYNAGTTGFAGEGVNARLQRILSFAGLTAPSWNLAAGAETMGRLNTQGTTVLDAINLVATTESGGAVVFVDTDGRVRFNDRTTRSTATPALTFDAQADLDGDSWAPSFDSYGRVNFSTVSNVAGSTTNYTDATSVTNDGLLAEQVTINASDIAAASSIANWRVVNTKPTPRVPQVAVDLVTAQNSAAIYAALPAITIGSLVRINNIPAAAVDATGAAARVFPATQIDGFVEGWSETISANTYRVVFDLSPVQPRFILETGTAGRLIEAPFTLTITFAPSKVDTVFIFATSGGGPTLSTSAGDYPMNLKMDEEIVTITSAPASAVSPQTVTVTRGALGTFADAHAINTSASVYTGSLVL